MREAVEGLPFLQPSDVAFAEVSCRAAEDNSCPGQQVGVSANNQLYLFPFLPLDVNFPLSQYGGIWFNVVFTMPEGACSDSDGPAELGTVLRIYSGILSVFTRFPTDGLQGLNSISTGHRTLCPVSRDPLRWAVHLATGLLAGQTSGWAKGVGQLEDAPISEPLFAQYPPPLNAYATALGALVPVTCVPHGRAVEAVAGLDRTGLGYVAVFISHCRGEVASSSRPVGTRHGARHEADPTGSRA